MSEPIPEVLPRKLPLSSRFPFLPPSYSLLAGAGNVTSLLLRCDHSVGRHVMPGSDSRLLPEGNLDCRDGNCTTDNRTCTASLACAPKQIGLALCFEQNKTIEYDLNCEDLVKASPGTNNSGFCIPCALGQYCPRGTITKTASIYENKCPNGKLCENPATATPCPSGTFCPRGTFLAGNAGFTVCDRPGMYCPEGTGGGNVSLSSPPGEDAISAFLQAPIWCKKGFYCPNSTFQAICPRYHFCWEGVTTPKPCSDSWDMSDFLVDRECAEGTGHVPRPWEGGAVLILFLVCLVMAWCLQKVLNVYLKSNLSKRLTATLMDATDQLTKIVNTGQVELYPAPSNNNQRDSGAIAPFPVRDGVMFAYSDLTLTVMSRGKAKVVVDHVSGEVPAATMTAVMGPSGAGKTSFMNVLCDRAGYGVTTGSLALNGKQGDRISNHRDLMGFVPQDDVVHDDLSVRENLIFAALNRLPIPIGERCRSHIFCSRQKRKGYLAYVDQVLNLLQISHIQDSIVGSVEKRGISGGQRKRVNIGLELVADPDVLFLDEPTSGLDSTSSEIILGALKDISRRGRTIIMVIHQPRYSIFTSMDNVIFLGPGGRTVYSGSPLDATDYFEMLGFYAPPKVNLADYFMDVISGTIARNNDPGFTSTDLFQFWKDWVAFSGKHYFDVYHHSNNTEAEAGKTASSGTNIHRHGVNDPGHVNYVFKPNQLDLVRRLFIEAMLASENSSATEAAINPMLTTEDSLGTFLRMITQARLMGAFSVHQSLALGLAVSTLFWGEGVTGKSLKGTLSRGSMADKMRKSDQLSKSSSSGSLKKATEEIELTESIDGNVSASTLVSGNLEYSDLLYALSDKDILGEMMDIRTSQLLEGGERQASLMGHIAEPPNSRPLHVIQRRRFGCDFQIFQFFLFALRYLLKRRRSIFSWMAELGLFVFSGIMIGSVVGKMDQAKSEGLLWMYGTLNLVVVFSILTTISALPTFGANKLIFWRESSSGFSTFSFWLARTSVDVIFLIVQTLFYSSIVYDFTRPSFTMYAYFTFWFCCGVANSGMGYFLSTIIPRDNMMLYTAMLTSMTALFLSGMQDGILYSDMLERSIAGEASVVDEIGMFLIDISFAKWMNEALLVTQASHTSIGRSQLITSNFLNHFGFGVIHQVSNETIENKILPLLSQEAGSLLPDPNLRHSNALISHSTLRLAMPLLIIGFCTRILALISLYVTDRPKQNKKSCLSLISQISSKLLCCTNCMKMENKQLKPMVGIVQLSNETEHTALGIQGDNDYVSDNANVEERVKRITRATMEAAHLDEILSSPNSSSTGEGNKWHKKRKSELLQSTARAGGVQERKQESWEQRMEAHGLSSQKKNRQMKKKMGLLFDLWDNMREGFINPDDMKSISKQYQNKIHVVFGDAEAWKRVQNIGLFSSQNFDQFFDWFVLQPTINEICSKVIRSSTKTSSSREEKTRVRSSSRTGKMRVHTRQQRLKALKKTMNARTNARRRRSVTDGHL